MHHDIVKEQTFISKAETGVDKDQATRDSVALLDKENAIFNTPDMLSSKNLTRYDCWDESKTIE
jgi:hypothetical protein